MYCMCVLFTCTYGRPSGEIYQLLTLTHSTDAVEVVARLTFAAVRAQLVDTTVTFTGLIRTPAFINVCRCERGYEQQKTLRQSRLLRCFACRNSEFFSCTNTAGAIFVEMISSTTVNRVPLADEGSYCVDTDLPSVTWACLS